MIHRSPLPLDREENLRLLNSDLSYDYALIGAGGAGMLWLLAMHEQAQLHGKQVIIFEPDSKTANDRTWCFWAKPDDPIVQSLSSVIDHSWSHMQTPHGPRQLDPYRYYHIRSATLYAWVKEIMAHYPGITWCNSPVQEVAVNEDGCSITSDQAYTAAVVLDSRLNAEQKAALQDAPLLWQSFVGYRIQIDKAGFDSETIDLMDFSIPQEEQCQFMYVLPNSEEEALVEMTRFGEEVLSEPEAADVLEPYIQERWGDFSRLEKEVGRIPMTLSLQENRASNMDNRYIPIGTAAGAVKPTTGYAFHTMYDHGQALAKALPKGEAPTITKRSRSTFYDSLLLDILQRQPAKGKPIFDALFSRIAPKRVMRFLQEKTPFLQELPILASLPPKPFLQALGSHWWPKTSPVWQPVHAVIVLAVLLLLVQAWLPSAVVVISQILLALGLLFPGIPHGAMDHVLTLPNHRITRKTWPFIAKYLGIMGLVMGLWMLSPALGLLLFIGYSAWHFGETDFREWRSFQGVPALLHGLGLLLFMLGTHWSTFVPYLQAYGLSAYSLSASTTDGIPVLGAQFLLIAGTFIAPEKRMAWAKTMVVLLLGAFLPLLAAFGLYFIGLHSSNGWRHIKQEHGFSTRKMIRLAFPFTALSFVGMALFAGIMYALGYTWSTGWPVFFVFLAAISAPHIWYMHRFYQQTAPVSAVTSPVLKKVG